MFDNFNDNRHVAVVFAAEFGALAAECAGLLGTEPDFVDDPGNGIFLDRECRDPPGVQDVIRRDQQPDLGADRNDHRLIDFEQVIFDAERVNTGCQAAGFDARSSQTRVKSDIGVLVFVMPFPLVAGNDNRVIGVTRILDAYHGFGGRNRHDEQNDDRDRRPDDFRGHAVRELGGFDAFRFTVLDERIDHHAKDENANGDTNPEHHHVQVERLRAELGDATRHIQAPVSDSRSCPEHPEQAKKESSYH